MRNEPFTVHPPQKHSWEVSEQPQPYSRESQRRTRSALSDRCSQISQCSLATSSRVRRSLRQKSISADLKHSSHPQATVGWIRSLHSDIYSRWDKVAISGCSTYTTPTIECLLIRSRHTAIFLTPCLTAGESLVRPFRFAYGEVRQLRNSLPCVLVEWEERNSLPCVLVEWEERNSSWHEVGEEERMKEEELNRRGKKREGNPGQSVGSDNS